MRTCGNYGWRVWEGTLCQEAALCSSADYIAPLFDHAHSLGRCSLTGELGELYVVDLGGTVSRIVSSATCKFSISPTRVTFARGGGDGTVAIAAGTSCAWTAESNASWITVTSGTPGTGNGSVTFSVAPYTGKPKNRNGTITIAGQTFSVRQSKYKTDERAVGSSVFRRMPHGIPWS